MAVWTSLNNRALFARPGNGIRSEGRREDSRGFTLLEVLIAFTILAVALTALLQTFSSGLHGLGSAEMSTAAVMHARAKMEEVGPLIAIEEGEQQGEFKDGSRWRVVMRAQEQADTDSLPLIPYEVEVTVFGDPGPEVTLRSLRLAPRK